MNRSIAAADAAVFLSAGLSLACNFVPGVRSV